MKLYDDATRANAAKRAFRMAEARKAYALLQPQIPWELLSDRGQIAYQKIVEYFQRNPLPCPDCGARVACVECGSPLERKGAKP